MGEKIYVNTHGIRLSIDTKMDLTDATKVAIKVKKPDGTEIEWPGFKNGQYIEYLIGENDLDIPGYYKIQAYVEKDNGNIVLLGETSGIYVYERFY